MAQERVFQRDGTINPPPSQIGLKAKQLFYWEVNFVYFLNLLPAANDTENVNEVSRVNVVS